MKKITILGRGNAGCLSAMHFYKYRGTKNKPIEIEMIYDPEIAPVPTGQGTLPEFSKLLWTCFGTSTFKGIPMKIKTGIMYENWGTKKDKFLHEFPLGTYGLHISPVDFQNHVFIGFRKAKYSFYLNLITATRIILLPLLVTFSIFGLFLSFNLGILFTLLIGILLIKRVYPRYKPIPSFDRRVINKISTFSLGNYIAYFFRHKPSILFRIL